MQKMKMCLSAQSLLHHFCALLNHKGIDQLPHFLGAIIHRYKHMISGVQTLNNMLRMNTIGEKNMKKKMKKKMKKNQTGMCIVHRVCS